jgi:hypothetical protein
MMFGLLPVDQRTRPLIWTITTKGSVAFECMAASGKEWNRVEKWWILIKRRNVQERLCMIEGTTLWMMLSAAASIAERDS